MTSEEIKTILENHKHWLNEDCDGWQKMNADLSNADLRDADLSNADLRYADFRGADFRGAKTFPSFRFLAQKQEASSHTKKRLARL